MNALARTIIISPTYNELDNAEILIPALFFHLPEISLLIVDDSSPDGTFSAVEKMQKQFPNLHLIKRPGKSGLGSAYKEAFQKIMNDDRFDAIVTMDADFSHDFRAIPEMLRALDACDLVVGSRYVPGGSIHNWSFLRQLLSRFANFYVRTILGMPVHDVTTGFTCFKKNILARITLEKMRAEGYAFLVEFKYQTWKHSLNIKEWPISFKERRAGVSKMSPHVIWESVKLPWQLRKK